MRNPDKLKQDMLSLIDLTAPCLSSSQDVLANPMEEGAGEGEEEVGSIVAAPNF